MAQETICASVKIEIDQKLTLERQAFDAKMKINNTTDTSVIQNVSVQIHVTDENGTPVEISDDPNNPNPAAKFFVQKPKMQNIAAVDGTGSVAAKTSGIIDWVLIPATDKPGFTGAAGDSPLGKKYLVGATLKYTFGGADSVLEVSPAPITVKPLPALTLDYFLPRDVWGAEDPLGNIGIAEPFTLGVRVKNNGYGIAKNLKIDSAQPKIIENKQGLLVNFQITGSYLNDATAEKTLLINFGDIAPKTSKMGRWIMTTSLAGKFVDFTATFSHADELGGEMTSLLQATNTHTLIHDVLVDLPGRDVIRDFLAQDPDAIRVYESDVTSDNIVTDQSATSSLNSVSNLNSQEHYSLKFPPTAGFVYLKLPDPFKGTKQLSSAVRSDTKNLSMQNVWLSKTRNEQTKGIEYWFNLFDSNSSGIYDIVFGEQSSVAQPPQIAFIADKTVNEGEQVGFLVEAASPSGKAITITASPLPSGATFTKNANSSGCATGRTCYTFNWNPAKGSAGTYLINYLVSDGSLSSSISATIQVNSSSPPNGPGTPMINSPLSNEQVDTLTPALSVQTPTDSQDPTKQVQFELYSDEAETHLIKSVSLDKAVNTAGTAVPTTWQLSSDLNLADMTNYWWRARGYDGSSSSNWVNAQFFVKLSNNPPELFNLTSPAQNAEVSTSTPTLSWTNSHSKEGNSITYSVMLYKDSALSDLLTQVTGLKEDPSGSTSWIVPTPLKNQTKYYWKVIANDSKGLQMPTDVNSFTVNASVVAPTAPVVLTPIDGGQSQDNNTLLTIKNSAESNNDPLMYVFEIDTVNSFDSANKKSSGLISQSDTNTSWTATNLVENQHYWWRVKAVDGKVESAWSVASFLMNAQNDPPPAPTIANPGNGAWSATQQPTLEANPVLDPEGEAVHYEFEIYKDAALTQKVMDASSPTTSLFVSNSLNDKTTYWWHVRALDPENAASAWSSPSVLYVSSGQYQDPAISVTYPNAPLAPVSNANGRKIAKILWKGTDANIGPVVALYYSADKSSFAGTLITDGLQQNSGTQTGEYDWDVTGLPSDTYYVYAVIYDTKSSSKAYAPGAVVIPRAKPSGSIFITSTAQPLYTRNDGSSQIIVGVHLRSAPTEDVVIPISSSNSKIGDVNPKSLTFTKNNWRIPQRLTINGKNDCDTEGDQPFKILLGKAESFDVNYAGISGKPISMINLGVRAPAVNSNNPNIHICHPYYVNMVEAERADSTGAIKPFWYYFLSTTLLNTGPAIKGAQVTLHSAGSGLVLIYPHLVFGAVDAGNTAKMGRYLVIGSYKRLSNPRRLLNSYTDFKWEEVEVTP